MNIDGTEAFPRRKFQIRWHSEILIFKEAQVVESVVGLARRKSEEVIDKHINAYSECKSSSGQPRRPDRRSIPAPSLQPLLIEGVEAAVS